MTERTVAGRYVLEEALGSSSWRATDTELGRQVLVRFGPAGETASAVLSHPNIARVFDQGEAGGERYAVLEFLPGGTLEERLPGLDESHANAVATDLAAALEYAHAQGVVHGSLSLTNVLLDGEGRAKVADFGGSGTPEEDLRALDSILEALAQVAPLPEEQTAVIAPPALQGAGRRTLVLAAAAALTLLVAGVSAAFLMTGDSSTGDLTTGSLSVPVPSATSIEETEAPPPQPTETKETTTTATTAPEPQPTTVPTTAPPPTTTAPPPLLPTTVELPPTATEELPPTTTATVPTPTVPEG